MKNKKMLIPFVIALVVLLLGVVVAFCLWKGNTTPETTPPVSAETETKEETTTEDSEELTETKTEEIPITTESPPTTTTQTPTTTTTLPTTTTQTPATTTNLPVTTTRPPVTTTTPPATTTSNDIEPDPSLLTFTKADIGKWVGRVSGFDLYVIDVQEGVGGFGLKHIDVVVKNTYGGWIPPGFSLWECIYCRQFPCPHGGDEKCPKYDIKLDSRYTCLHCFKPHGYGLECCVRWMADVNCPRCGNFVKSHTCHNCPS